MYRGIVNVRILDRMGDYGTMNGYGEVFSDGPEKRAQSRIIFSVDPCSTARMHRSAC